MKHGQVMARTGLQRFDTAHDHNATPITDRPQATPMLTIIFTDGQSGRIKPGPHDDPLFSVGIDDTMQGGNFQGSGP